MQTVIRLAAAVAAVTIFAAAAPVTAEQAATWPTRVEAEYSLHFTGFGKLGKLHYKSELQGNEYKISGSAEVKVPLIYTWSSTVAGAGRISSDTTQPATYNFSSLSKPVIGRAKTLSIRLGLKDQGVAQVNIIPPHNPGGDHYVPLKPEHMRGVIDPLTAVMAMSRIASGSPCGRRLSIFDGKQRFDLVMSAAGQQKVAETRPSGQPPIGFLCKVRYVPVAGFKDTEDFRRMVDSSSAEIALRPIPSANLAVPYRVTVATKWGTATMLLQRMDIVAPGEKQIALVH